MQGESTKARYQKRHQALKDERQSWLSHWRELSDYIQPRRGRFLTSDRNKGGKRNENIINSTATRALRILASGMMAGITSPSRPWFKLTTQDPKLAKHGGVKAWVAECEEIMRSYFARSNIYNGLHQLYGDLATFGTSVIFIESDVEDVLRVYVLPIGQYCLANSARQAVDSCYREFSMTVGQLVEEFKLENCSQQVQDQYKQGNLDTWHDVVHVLQPNRGYQEGKLGPVGMPFSSCWYEKDSSDGENKLLREGGYEENPAMCVRWSVTGEDVYGNGPGMEVLGDARALQITERRAAQAFDKIVTPPMQGPSTMMAQQASLHPGEIIKVDAIHPGQTFKPAIDIHPSAIQVAELKIRTFEQRINAGFYADLWLALTESDGEMTAREVAERHEEKLLQLGPVMERLQDELLDPLIDRTFSILLRLGYFPPPPPELQGIDLRVEYISTMAQAQKLLGITAMEKQTTFTVNLANGTARADVIDNLNLDVVVRKYADMLGVPEGVVRSDEEVAAIRAQRAKLKQQQQQMQAAMAAAEGAKTLSETSTGPDNALGQMLEGLGAK